MSYPKKPSGRGNSADNQSNSRLSEGRKEKLLAIQERETLKGLLIRKFAEKYGKTGKGTTDVIQREVVEFMKNEKLTEENLRRLEDRIKDLTGASKREQQSQRPPSQQQAPLMAASRGVLENTSHGNLARPPSNQGLQQSQVQQLAASRRVRDDDAVSNVDSVGPRSVYHLNEDDEWAAIMKYDSDLYKKERELEQMMEKERKKKVKMELDSQIEEKKRMKNMEKDELKRYMDVQGTLLTNFDSREKQKEEEKKSRNLQEKLSRDKQLQEENLRKKMDRKQEREMDALLVRKIKEEIDNEQQQNLNKKLNERDRLLRVMVENEENKKKMTEDARREKNEDIKAQEEYTRLIEKQEADREKELQDREARAKKLMNMMADTVIKDQKAMLLDEEKKILKYYLEREDKAMKDEEMRKRKLFEQKLEVKKFLDQQVEEKNGRKVQENEFNKKQADIWKKDTEDFYDNEKRKNDYIKDVNKQHAEILKQQMGQPGGAKKPFGKMNDRELLLNKDRLKVVAANHDGFVKTQL